VVCPSSDKYEANEGSICVVHESTFKAAYDSIDVFPRGTFACILAMCALSAQRIKSGASSAPSLAMASIASRPYLEDALSVVLDDSCYLKDLPSIQAVHLLCVTAMEAGNVPLYNRLMGLYHTVIADLGLADESRWPQSMTPVERETRRRLFWHMYRLEVHTALILGHVVRCPESQIAVEYPSDRKFDDLEPASTSEWLTGWNFVTDLYKGVEYLLVHFRLLKSQSRRSGTNMFLPTFGRLDESSKTRLVEGLTSTYERLPDRVKVATSVPTNVNGARCIYQTANIICTYQVQF
jgi:hypothetical protein